MKNLRIDAGTTSAAPNTSKRVNRFELQFVLSLGGKCGYKRGDKRIGSRRYFEAVNSLVVYRWRMVQSWIAVHKTDRVIGFCERVIPRGIEIVCCL